MNVAAAKPNRPRIDGAAIGVRLMRIRPSMPGTAVFCGGDVSCVVHVHSDYSDGTATVAEICARRGGPGPTPSC